MLAEPIRGRRRPRGTRSCRTADPTPRDARPSAPRVPDRRSGRPDPGGAERLPPRRGVAPTRRGDAQARCRDHRRDARDPTAGSRRPRRDLQARPDAEPHARPPRGRLRARAQVRRRREPRAPHAPGPPAYRARARPAPAALDRRARAGTTLRRRGDRAPEPARRGSPADRPRRRRIAPREARAPLGTGDASRRRGALREPRRAGRPDRDRGGQRGLGESRPTRFGSSRHSATSSTTRSSTVKAKCACRRFGAKGRSSCM